jgi:hypothetical integral membrane protein (TIGR02206 family)
MGEYFRKDYTGEPFVLFGPAHLVALAIVAAAVIFILFFWRNPSPKSRLRLRYLMAAVLLINETGWHLWNVFTGQWTIQMLPLHLCSVLVFASAYLLISKNYHVYEFTYFLGIGGAMQALLTPDAGIYGFPHIKFFFTMISHGLIVVSSVYMTAIEGYRPYWRSFINVAIYTNIYMAVVFVVNLVIKSNYMFIARKPDTASLIDLLGPWPWYILALEGIGFAVFLILYLPFVVKDWWASKQKVSTDPA